MVFLQTVQPEVENNSARIAYLSRESRRADSKKSKLKHKPTTNDRLRLSNSFAARSSDKCALACFASHSTFPDRVTVPTVACYV